MLVCIHGNIGAGKTTFLETNLQYRDYEIVPENLDNILPLLKEYYIAINKGFCDENLIEKEQELIIQVQSLFIKNRLQAYSKIKQDKNYIFERTIQEDYNIFGYILSKLLNDNNKKKLIKLYQNAIKQEPHFDKHIYLYEPLIILKERIFKRNRDGENINQKYLEQLQYRYEKLFGTQQTII